MFYASSEAILKPSSILRELSITNTFIFTHYYFLYTKIKLRIDCNLGRQLVDCFFTFGFVSLQTQARPTWKIPGQDYWPVSLGFMLWWSGLAKEGLSMWDVIKFCDLCMAELQEWWIWDMGRSYYTTCPLHHKATPPPRSPARTEVNSLTSGLENSRTEKGRIYIWMGMIDSFIGIWVISIWCKYSISVYALHSSPTHAVLWCYVKKS